MHNTDTDTMLLCVVLGRTTVAQDLHLQRRFHRFYSPTEGRIEYPVSCDSHAFDVFRDEFETEGGPAVDYASVITLPYPVEQFTPFDEDEIGGTLLYEAGGEPGEWIAEPDITA